jgi:hypothetical protein
LGWSVYFSNTGTVIIIAFLEALFTGFTTDEITAGENNGRLSERDKLFGNAAFEGVCHRSGTYGGARTHRVFEILNADKSIACRCAIVNDDIGDVGKFFAAAVQCSGGVAMIYRDGSDHGHMLPFGLEGDIHDDFIDAAV